MRHDDEAGTALYIHRAPSTDHRAVKYGMIYTANKYMRCLCLFLSCT